MIQKLPGNAKIPLSPDKSEVFILKDGDQRRLAIYVVPKSKIEEFNTNFTEALKDKLKKEYNVTELHMTKYSKCF